MPSIPEPVHLNNHHRDTLSRIFGHPASHNIKWQAVLSLLEALGSVAERHDGKFLVTLGPETETFERKSRSIHPASRAFEGNADRLPRILRHRKRLDAPARLGRELDRLAAQSPTDPNGPVDGAAQHDHYLYGTPKRENP